LILLFAIIGGFIHAFLSYFIWNLFGYAEGCAVGFSGVLFGLIVIQTALSNAEKQSILGLFEVPAKLYPWALLIFMQVIVPNASFMGHLSGILVGYLYIYGGLDKLKLSPSTLNKIESRFLSRLVRSPMYIANPNLGLTLPGPSGNNASANNNQGYSLLTNLGFGNSGNSPSQAQRSSSQGHILGSSANFTTSQSPPAMSKSTDTEQAAPLYTEELVTKLVQMGYNKTQAANALTATLGNLDAAANLLASSS